MTDRRGRIEKHIISVNRHLPFHLHPLHPPAFPSPPQHSDPQLKHGNTLNLHAHPLRQLMHRHTTPGRLMAEPLLILGVHLRKIGHVHQEHIHFDHLPDGRPPRFQHRLEVRNAGARLSRDAAVDQVARAVGGDLPAAVELRWCADGLGLRGREGGD